MRRQNDLRDELAAAAAALDDYDYPLARSRLGALRQAHPEDAEVFDAWVTLLVDHLGDDAGALDASPPRAAVRDATRARLVTAAARASRTDLARKWIAELDPEHHGDAWTRWLDALLAAGDLAAAAHESRAVRAKRALSGALSEALARVDAALRPERERAREEALARRAHETRGAIAALTASLDEGRWERALLALSSLDDTDPSMGDELDALRARALGQRDEAMRESSARRVEAVERALAQRVDRESLRALASLREDERLSVSGSLVPQGFIALLGEARVREADAIDATLALREASRQADPAVVTATLRRHAATLRRIDAGRAALDVAEDALARAPQARVAAEADPTSSLRAEIESIAAQGFTLAAWRRAEREGLDDLARTLAASATRRYALTWEREIAGPPEEAHAELLRGDAAVAYPGGVDAAMSVSVSGRTVTTRRFDLRTGAVSLRARAWLDDDFVATSSRWDGDHLALASRDAVLSVDTREGALRAYSKVPSAGALAESTLACGDPDFAWVTGRDARGAPTTSVIDLARGGRVSRFACGDIVPVDGSTEMLCLDAGEGALRLRDAHGVVIATAGFARDGELLAACRSPLGRGVFATFRERHPQTAHDRRRAIPPSYSLVLIHLRAGTREPQTLTLRSCARDDVAAVSASPASGVVWVRLGPRDLQGELVCIDAERMRVRSRRALAAGVSLGVTGTGAFLAFVSTRRCGWQHDPTIDPPGAGLDPPLAAHQPSLSFGLPCAPIADELAWRAHAPAVSALIDGRRAEWDEACASLRRAPASLLGMHRVLIACRRERDADAALAAARRAHPQHAGLRVEAAGRAWARGDAAGVRALLEGAELLGLGDELAHARHLLGLARLAEGDERGAEEAWREGLDAPIVRPSCALAGCVEVIGATARGGAPSSYVIVEALAGTSRAAALAVEALSAGAA